jgi:O-methyltransferase involved in polyketide biosynthesis
MATEINPDTDSRNYSTISPSAKALLFMKGLTPIPYAKEAATLLAYPDPYTPDYSNRQPGFWARVYHFESRYWSIDQLLSDLLSADRPQNILELSSGFSFRGLALTKERPVYYIDTDLPGIINTKKEFVNTLSNDQTPSKGTLEILPLNALDEKEFEAIVDHFPPGELIIVNEGLLVYLDTKEKERLCDIIRRILERRGGYWITADAYIKKELKDPALDQGDTLKQFFEQHHINDNKFADFDEAAAFFNRMGFTIDKEAVPDYSRMSSLKYLTASASPGLLAKMKQSGKIQTTWRLRITGSDAQ